MPRATFKSGNWIEYRDKFSPGDRWAVRDAPDVVQEEGRVVVQNGTGNVWKAFLALALTGWSYPEPVPAEGGGYKVLDRYPDDLDDMNEMEEALLPLLRKVQGIRPNPEAPATTGATSPAS